MRQTGEFSTILDLQVGRGPGLGIGQSGQYPLFTLQAKRVARIAVQHRQVKQGFVMGFMPADLPGGRYQTLSHQVFRQAQLIQHFQRRGVKGGSPEVIADGAGFVYHQSFNTGAGQTQTCDKADRSGTTDENSNMRHEGSVRLNAGMSRIFLTRKRIAGSRQPQEAIASAERRSQAVPSPD